jgi:hypothetical protein
MCLSGKTLADITGSGCVTKILMTIPPC